MRQYRQTRPASTGKTPFIATLFDHEDATAPPPGILPQMMGSWHLHDGEALEAYREWPEPDVIISDGAYGVGGFHGDPRTPEGLVDWYQEHVEEWSKHSHPATTLWFWNTEVGWATVHPLLAAHGWQYQQLIVWDKGIAHIAGNVNGKTIRRFPVVTEVCGYYTRRLELPTLDRGSIPVQDWMRHEWNRTGLPMRLANVACGVKDAATRKYLTSDWMWYMPPPEAMEAMASYANAHGRPAGRPYYTLDGSQPVTAEAWRRLRHNWTHEHGITNVWQHPPVNGTERLKGTGQRSAPRVYKPTSSAAAHLNQKPLEFMRRIVYAASQTGDVVWEPFGGLCTATVVAAEMGRHAYAAESHKTFARLARERLTGIIPDSALDT